MKIKAISIWQPWASLIAVGAKKFETRSWATSYRGPLLICAAKSRKGLVAFDDPVFAGVAKTFLPDGFSLSMGHAVAVADLTDCLSTFNYQIDWIGKEATFGDFTIGRYAWKLENIRAISPFPVTGNPGLFEVEVEDSLFEGII